MQARDSYPVIRLIEIEKKIRVSNHLIDLFVNKLIINRNSF